MPGVPSGKGCDACRKLKKRCDQTKPICKRCQRLGLECINNGVKRWKFMPQASSPDDQQLIVAGTSAPPRPRRSPGNDITLMTASLISVLQVEDAKHDVLQSGGQFFLDLPSRLGHNPMLDASAKALVSSYHYVHTRNLDGPTLANYGRALEQLRVGMQDCSYSVAVKLYAVILTVFSQDWIDNKNREWALHRQTIAFILQDALARGTLGEINPKYIHPVSQLVVWESWLNPHVKIGEWFWQVLSQCTGPRPHSYQRGHTFLSLDVETQAEISVWLRDPLAHMYQLSCAYRLALEELPSIRLLAEQFEAALKLPGATDHIRRSRHAFLVGRAIIVLIAARLNRVLRIFGDEPGLLEEAHALVDDVIPLALSTYNIRPLGASFVNKALKVVWASSLDDYRRQEVEDIMIELQKDFADADYLNDAAWIRSRFELMESGAY